LTAHGDEDSFFQWLKSIPSVIDYHGAGRELRINVDYESVNKYDMMELIALFYRYKADLKQLRALDRQDFREFLHDKERYWYDSMFE
jgi:hypothetical protein